MNTDSYPYVSYTIDPTKIDRTKLMEKIMKKNDTVYKVLCNDSRYLTFDDQESRFYRSVVVDDHDNLLCFSPQTSVSMDVFTNATPDSADLFVNEIVEGTMINVFYDERTQSWEIATRGSIGGRYWYYRTQYIINEEGVPPLNAQPTPQMTFRNMLMDAFRMDRTEDHLNSIPLFAELPKEYCYSFVLQHPANHIVLSIGEPRIYLVAVYSLLNKAKKQVQYVSPLVYEEWKCFHGVNQCILFPQRYSSWKEEGQKVSVKEIAEDLTNRYCSAHSDYHLVGLMLSNMRTGERTPISNPAYEELKNIRGNNPNLQYQYFCLSRIGQIPKFLEYFPCYKKLFRHFQKQYQDLITNVHQSYFSYYIKKEGLPIAKKFFIHASKIHHEIFLPSLKADNKVIIKRNVVADYFEKMTPVELLYFLNYDRRQASKERRKTKLGVLMTEEDPLEDGEIPEI